jgi:hypothetical protein
VYGVIGIPVTIPPVESFSDANEYDREVLPNTTSELIKFIKSYGVFAAGTSTWNLAVTAPVSNVYLYRRNIKSEFCSAVHVEPFCDKNNEPP